MKAHGAILLARIGAAHGVRGEVRVKSFTADPLALKGYGPLACADGRAFRIERMRPAKEVVIAKFHGVDTREAAEALNGTDLFVAREKLPEADDDEFYHADLIGLAAVGESGEEIGTVAAIHDFGAGDIVEIAPARGAPVLVPFTRAAVPTIDIGGGRIVVVPPAVAAEDANEGESRE